MDTSNLGDRHLDDFRDKRYFSICKCILHIKKKKYIFIFFEFHIFVESDAKFPRLALH